MSGCMVRMSDLLPGQSGLVLNTAENRQLRDIGLCCGCRVECVQKSPLGDPTAYRIRGAIMAVRMCDSQKIMVQTEVEYD